MPLELVVDAATATVRLSCDLAGFVELEEAEELIDRGVQLKLTKQQVRDLPGVDLGQPER